MSHTIRYNPETAVIESKVQGDLTLSEIKAMLTEVAQVANESGCTRLLTDYREAKLRLSTLEIYRIPKTYSDIFAPSGISVYQLKRALVTARDRKDYRFFESVTANSGQNAKVFFDMDEARKWLLEK